MKIKIIMLTFLCMSFVQAQAYYGSLTASDGGLGGTGFWVSDNGESGWFPASISWDVTQNTDSTWHYDYTLEVYRADISHLIIESSSTFDSSNLLSTNQTGFIEISSFTSASGNPYLPAEMSGIKFDIGKEGVAESEYTTVNMVFDSDRVPVWGDFYAKCGAVGGTQNTVWNAGISDVDPSDAIADGSIANHILVPDSVIPEPATLSLLALGGLALRKKKA